MNKEQNAALEAERVEFEGHVIASAGRPIGLELARHPIRGEEYECRTMQTRWQDWQARAQLAAPAELPDGWIAVAERLPSIGEKCLIKIPVCRSFEVEGAEYKGDGDWLGAWCSRKGRNQTYKVSHWMLASDLLNGGRV